MVISLDGEEWFIATDPKNVGRKETWWNEPVPGAKQTKVPWIIQDPFPGRKLNHIDPLIQTYV